MNKPPLLSEGQIKAIVDQLAGKLSEYITEHNSNEFMIVCLMDGAMIFAADILRALFKLGHDPIVESLSLTSYGDDQQSSGRVVCLKDIQRPVSGRNVIILDDVYETGLTLDHARRHILNLGAKSVKACVFAQKPYESPAGELPEFIGWQAPDEFLIGYGLDDKGRHRGQPFISSV